MGICPFHKKFSAKCPISEIIYGNAPILKFNFLKIEFQFKTRFLDNRVIANWKLKKKKNSRTWVPWKNLSGTRVSRTWVGVPEKEFFFLSPCSL